MATKLFQTTLRGRTAAITGASGGIGLAIAERFLHEGSSVVLLGRNAEKLKAAAATLPYDDRVRKYVLDVRLEQSWADTIPFFVSSSICCRDVILTTPARCRHPRQLRWDYPAVPVSSDK